jgi:alkyldihydroxyacetonephosphate synthase
MEKEYYYDLVHSELAEIVGEQNILTSELERTIYSIGRAWLTRTWKAQGVELPKADFIVQPETEEQIIRILSLANREKIPVVPFGGLSSGMRGNIPFYGGIMLDVKRLDRIKTVSDKSLTAKVEAGVNCWKLEDELNRLGYTSGHSPASFFCSCIGGFIACRGAGRLSTKYGKMEDMILGLRVVLPSGEVMATRPVPAHATGPDLKQLFIGSEGTLGIVTEATIKIYPLPEERCFRGLMFPTLHQGIEAMRKIMRADLVPCMARLYDEEETKTKVKDTWGVKGQGSFLVLGFDGSKKRVNLEESAALEICEGEGGKDLGREPGEYWWAHAWDDYYPTPKSVKEYSALQGGGRSLGATSDTCASYDVIEDIYRDMKETFMEKFGKSYGGWFYGHFSHWYRNGAALYPRWHLYDPPSGKKLIELYFEVWGTMAKVILKHGGVLNHHHGIGRVLSDYLPLQDSGSFEVLKKVKSALDPNGIMNPGVLGLR